MIEITMEQLIGYTLAVAVPTLLFFWRLHSMIKKTYDMHHDPDEHGFGNGTTNDMLEGHMKDELKMHAENMVIQRDMKHAIKELSHYVRWSAKERIGRDPPPYIRNGD